MGSQHTVGAQKMLADVRVMGLCPAGRESWPDLLADASARGRCWMNDDAE